ERRGRSALLLPFAPTIKRVGSQRSAEEAEQGCCGGDDDMPKLPILPVDDLLHVGSRVRVGTRTSGLPRASKIAHAATSLTTDEPAGSRCVPRAARTNGHSSFPFRNV